jgi:hypothetical protein
MENDQDNLLGSLGLIFPQNSYQLQNFKVIYSDFHHKANESAINPNRILKKIDYENTEVSNVDYHKRTVLAAEIVYQLQNDRHFGHLKLEKVLYLCQNVNRVSFHANFLKQAMGPYDPILIRSLDSQFLKNKWFRYNHNSFPKYTALENVGNHKEWYNRYFGKYAADIDTLISTFQIFTADQIELVATIFECWKEVLEEKKQFDVELIKEKVYSWSEFKTKFTPTQINNAVTWMEEKGIFPTET